MIKKNSSRTAIVAILLIFSMILTQFSSVLTASLANSVVEETGSEDDNSEQSVISNDLILVDDPGSDESVAGDGSEDGNPIAANDSETEGSAAINDSGSDNSAGADGSASSSEAQETVSSDPSEEADEGEEEFYTGALDYYRSGISLFSTDSGKVVVKYTGELDNYLGRKSGLKYIETDGSNPDLNGKWRMVYCLYQAKATPNGEVNWNPNKSVMQKVVYVMAYGVRYWGKQSEYEGYRYGGNWRKDYYACQMAIHVLQGEYSMSVLNRSSDPALYDLVQKIVNDANNSANYSNFDGSKYKDVQYNITPATQNQWVAYSYKGVAGYATKAYYKQEIKDTYGARPEWLDQVTGAITSGPDGAQLIWRDSTNASDFYFWMPADKFDAAVAAGGGTIKAQIDAKLPSYLSGWYYEPVGDWQPVTFFEPSWTAVSTVGRVEAVLPTTTPDPPPETSTDPPETVGPPDGTTYCCIKASKWADPPNGDRVVEGQTIKYTITANNQGATTAYNIPIFDIIPAHTTLKSIQGGGSSQTNADGNMEVSWNIARIGVDETVTVSFEVTVNPMAAGETYRQIWNTGYVNGEQTPDIMHQQYPAIITQTKSALPPSGSIVNAGDEIVYTITVQNNGVDPAREIPVSDQIPDGTTFVSATGGASPDGDGKLTWTIGELKTGESIEYSFTVKVNDLPYGIEKRNIENTAVVNNINTNTTFHYQHSDDVYGYKRASVANLSNVREGDIITYYIDVHNNGNEIAKNVPVTDLIPEKTTYVNGSVSSVNGGQYNSGNNEVSWTIPAISPGEFAIVSFQVTVNDMELGVLEDNIINFARVKNLPTNEVQHTVVRWLVESSKEAIPVDSSVVEEGDIIRYSIPVQNKGNIVARNVQASDVIPEGTTYVEGSATYGGVLDPATNTLNWTIPALAANGTAVLYFEVKVNKLVPGEHTFKIINRAVVEGKDTNKVEHTVKKPIITYSKDSSPITDTVVYPDQYITYTIVVRNIGSLPDKNVKVIDNIPVGTIFDPGSITGPGSYQTATNRIEWDIPTIPAFGEVYLTFRVQVLPLDYGVEEFIVVNKAQIYAYDVDGKYTNEINHIVRPKRLLPKKYADLPDGSVVRPGEQITYTIEITNNRGEPAVYVPVWDTIPSGTSYVPGSADNGGILKEVNTVTKRVEWVIPKIEPGETFKLTFKVVADELPEGIYSKKIYNMALIGEGGTKTDAGVPDIPTNEVEHNITKPIVVPTKESVPESGSQVYVGDEITYTIKLHNNSDAAAINVPVKDVIPNGTTYKVGTASSGFQYDSKTKQLSWVIPSIPAKGDAYVSFKVIVNELPYGQTTRTIHNVGYCGDGGGTSDNPGTCETPTNEVDHIVILPPVSGEKSSVPSTGSTVQAGEVITYKISVTNEATVKIYNVPVYDSVPAGTSFVENSTSHSGVWDSNLNRVGWNIQEMEPGETIVVEFKVVVNPLLSGMTTRTIRNIAIVGGTATNETEHLVEKPFIYGVKTSNPVSGSRVVGDQDITYTIRVHNDGTTAATNVKVVDYLPANTKFIVSSISPTSGRYIDDAEGQRVEWTIASIAAGAYRDVSFTVTVNPIVQGEMYRLVDNYATVNNLRTNHVYHYLYETPYYGLKTSDPVSGSAVKAGDIITYTINVKNTDVLAARNMVISDKIPTGTTYVDGSANPSDGALDIYSNTVKWVIPTMASGEERTFTFQVKVNEMPAGQTYRYIKNQAFVNSTPTNETEHIQENPVLTSEKYSDPEGGSIVRHGSEITYFIKVRNTGTITADSVNIYDYIPAGTTYVGGSADNGGVYDETSGRIDWKLFNLDVQNEIIVSFKVKVDKLPESMTSRHIRNIGVVNEIPTNPVPHEVKKPYIVAEKTADPVHRSEVYEGQIIRYKITVTNIGEISDSEINVRELVPEGTTLLRDSVTDGGKVVERTINWTIPYLLNGQSKSIYFDVSVDPLPTGMAFREITNTALYGQGGELPETPTNEVIHYMNKAQIKATKYADPAAGSTVTVGSKVNYTISLFNQGTHTASNTNVIDEIPEGTTFVPGSIIGNGSYNAALNRIEWNVTNINAGNTAYIGFQVIVSPLPAGETTGIIKNYAIVDGDPTNEIEHPTRNPNVVAVKTAEPSHNSTVSPRDEITYKITLTNNGAQEAVYIPVSDVIPQGTTYVPGSCNMDGMYYSGNTRLNWVIPSLKPGESVELTFRVTVDDLSVGVSEMVITNYALYGQGGGTYDNPGIPEIPTNEVNHTVKLPVISGEKLANPVSGSDVEQGQVITYTIIVRNFGDKVAENVPVTDYLSTDLIFESIQNDGQFNNATRMLSWVIPSIAPLGGEARVTFTARVAANMLSGMTMKPIYNNAVVDGRSTNTTIHYVHEGGSTTDGNPNLNIYKSSSPSTGSTVQEGEVITYYLTVSNNGDAAANNVTVTDAVPTGTTYVSSGTTPAPSVNNNTLTWNLGTLAAGASRTLQFSVRVDSLGSVSSRTIKNVAVVTGDNALPKNSNEVSHIVNTEISNPYFSVAKTSNPASGSKVEQGSQIVYTITVNNLTATPLTNVSVIDAIPDGLSYVSSTNGGVISGSSVQWTIASISAYGQAQVSFVARVDNLPAGITYKSYINQASATAQGVTQNSNTTTHYAQTAQTDPNNPYISAVKRSTPYSGTTVNQGDEITYYIDVKNEGTTAVNDIRITDGIPTGTTYVPGSANNGGVMIGNSLSWSISSIGAGATFTVSFKVKVDNLPSDINHRTIWNQATIIGPYNYVITNITTHEVYGSSQDSQFFAVKRSNPPSGSIVGEGQTITYYMDIFNTGSTVLKNVKVYDTIPGNVIVTGIQNGGMVTGTTIEWTISSINPGASATVSFSVVPKTGNTAEIRNVARVVADGTEKPTGEVVHYPENPAFSTWKSANPVSGTTVQDGDKIEYYVSVRNDGLSVLNNVAITDSIPTGTTYQSGSADNGGILSGNTLTWNIPSMAPGETKTVRFSVTVNPLGAGGVVNIRNYAAVRAGNRETITNEVVHPHGSTGSIIAAKRSNPVSGSLVQRGDLITYYIDVQNIGNSTVQNVSIQDAVPAGSTLVNIGNSGAISGGIVYWTLGTLAAGEVRTVSFTVRVNETTTGYIRNRAIITWPSGSTDTNEVIHLVDSGMITATKSSNPATGSIVKTGDVITYFITVRNTGSTTAINIPVKDTVPSMTKLVSGSITENGSYNGTTNTITWNIPVLTPGQSKVLSFQVSVNTLPTNSSGTIRNVAYYGQGGDTPDIPTNPTEHNPDWLGLYSIKTSNPVSGSRVRVGQEIEYSITVYNYGNSTAANVIVTDPIPSGMRYVNGSADNNGTHQNGTMAWVIPQIAAGQSVTVKFKAVILPLPEGVTYMSYKNVAYVNNVPGGETEHIIDDRSIVTGIKRSDPVSGSRVTAGQLITYSIDVINNGNIAAENITITDAVPGGTTLVSIQNGGAQIGNVVAWSIASLAAGKTSTVSFTVRVDTLPEGLSGRIIRNVATISPAGKTPTETNETTHIQPPINANLTTLKSSNPPSGSSVNEGDIVNYYITVVNYGSAAAVNTVVTDQIPVGMQYVNGSADNGGIHSSDMVTWNIPYIAPGSSTIVSFSAKVLPLPEGTTYRNYHNVSYVNGMPGGSTDHNIYNPGYTGIAGVKKSNPVSGSSVTAGQLITYSIDVTNYGNIAAENITITDAVPGGTTLVSIQNGGAQIGNAVAWSIASLAAGKTSTVSFTVRVDTLPEGLSGRIIRNVATITPAGQTPTETNETTHIQPPVNASLTTLKSSNPPSGSIINEGDIVKYYITVVNYGSVPAVNTVITDLIPAGMQYVDGSADNGGIHSSDMVTWNIPYIAPGSSTIVSFSAKVLPLPAGTTYRNYHNVSYVNGTPGGSTDHNIYDPSYTGIAGVKKSNPVSGSSVTAGQLITYSIDVTNYGNIATENITITDAVPGGTTLVSIQNGGAQIGNAVVWGIASLAAGETRTVSFTVSVNPSTDNALKVIGNIAVITGGGKGPTETNEVTHVIIPPYQSLLANVKTSVPASGSLVKEGDLVNYSITVTNYGTTEAKNVLETDPLPDGMQFVSAENGGTAVGNMVIWNIASIPAGQSVTVKFVAKVLPLPEGTTYKSFRNVAYVNGIPSGETEHIVDNRGSVSGVKSADPASGSNVVAGQEITYTINVTNHSSKTAGGVVVKDAVPDGTTLKTINDGGTLSENVITWTITSLAPGETKPVRFIVTVNQIPEGSSKLIRNSAIVSHGGKDIPTNETNHTNNNCSGDSMLITKSTDISPTQRVKSGDIIKYYITVRNNSSKVLNNVIINDQVPVGTTYVKNSAKPALSSFNDGMLTWEFDRIDPYQIVSVEFSVRVNDDTPGTIVNTAYVNNKPTNTIIIDKGNNNTTNTTNTTNTNSGNSTNNNSNTGSRNLPQTGDSAPVWEIVLLVLSVLLGVIVFITKRKKPVNI